MEFQNYDKEDINSLSKEELVEYLHKLALTKRLNFLLGSGVSSPAIPLMSQVKADTRDMEKAKKAMRRKSVSEKQADNYKLICIIKEVSKEIIGQKNTLVASKKKRIKEKLEEYHDFIKTISDVLNKSNSREIPREANIFTTNYDLFIEKAVDKVLKETSLVFNDGARGYFKRYLNSSNFNRTVSYEGLNNNYIDELPSLSLIKPHGSVNWDKKGENILVKDRIISHPMVVPPDGFEGRTAFMDDHFHDMLREFQLELDKQESVLFVLGFSFQDTHISKMVQRALNNRSLIIICFCWDKKNKKEYLKNLRYSIKPMNMKFILPKQLNRNNLELKDLTAVLKGKL